MFSNTMNGFQDNPTWLVEYPKELLIFLVTRTTNCDARQPQTLKIAYMARLTKQLSRWYKSKKTAI